MPILTPEMLSEIVPPEKSGRRLRIALSHEFVELYRGDKDLKVGKILARDYNCEIVHLGTNIASLADSRIFRSKNYPIDRVGPLPVDYYLLLMKTKLVVHRKGDIGMGGFFRWTPAIIPLLLRWKPDLIFENPYLTLSPRSFMTFLASRILRIPLIYIDCGDIVNKKGWKNRLALPFEKIAVRKSSAVITYNNAGKQRFLDKYGYPEDKIHVIPKPVDTSRFSPDIDSRQFRLKYNLDGKFVVAYFGRLCANKGARTFLKAADIMRIRGADKDTVFLFVGGNLEAEHSAEFSRHLKTLSLDSVKITGWHPYDDMPQAYSGVDIAVFPDVTNPPGFSTVLSESMAAGLPIIIGIKGWESAVPIIDGQNGLIVESGNPEQIADKIELLRNNKQLVQKLSASVRDFAKREMDYDNVVDKYYELFLKITGKYITEVTNEDYAKSGRTKTTVR
ncbi:MAG: glycosyltransferase [candidate division Zixibacteria bacterium]